MSIRFLDEKRTVVRVGSGGRAVGDARERFLMRRSVELRASGAGDLRWQAVFGCQIIWNSSIRRAGERGGARWASHDNDMRTEKSSCLNELNARFLGRHQLVIGVSGVGKCFVSESIGEDYCGCPRLCRVAGAVRWVGRCHEVQLPVVVDVVLNVGHGTQVSAPFRRTASGS
jgi:hypothetical protein